MARGTSKRAPPNVDRTTDFERSKQRLAGGALMFKPVLSALAVAAMATGLASCDKMGLGQQPAAAPAATPSGPSAASASSGAAPSMAPSMEASRAYQTVVIPGSSSASVGVFRINVSTGQVSFGWGSATSMTPIADLALPAGQYRLVGWSQPAGADGSVSWGMVRMDAMSGRVWTLNGAVPYN